MRCFVIPALFLLAACDTVMPGNTSVTTSSVGDYRIGMPASQVQGLEGSFNPGSANDECLQMPNKGHGLLMMFEKGSLARVDIVRGDYKTPEGIHIGSSEKDVKDAYGKRVATLPQKYVAKGHYLNVISAGHGYVFETDGTKVNRIRVGKQPALTYVEGCS